MFANYLRRSFRSMRRSKFYTLLHVFGLTALVFCSFVQFSCTAQQQQSIGNSPDAVYANFAEGYSNLEAERITEQYAQDAVLMDLYQNSQPSSLQGREAIRKYFTEFFQPFKNEKARFSLHFKVIARKQNDSVIFDNGVTRLDIIRFNTAPQSVFSKFSTMLVREGTTWKLKTDATANATFLEYENAQPHTAGLVIPALSPNEDVLYPEFYDTLVGNYRTTDNQTVIIGRSQRRLFAYFEQTRDFRGLQKKDATTWIAGKTVLSDSTTLCLRFDGESLEITRLGDNSFMQEKVQQAKKQDLYKTEKIVYPTKNGILLHGTLFLPQKPNGKAIVMVHGSGAQDRNGYASIIRLLADVCCREGVTVLTYDKQGVGSSGGNWETASFTDLADDAIAGITYLQTRKDMKLRKIGLAGSSQAGWVIAKAMERFHNIDFSLLIGAAGSGINVIEQNLYNTRTQMQCVGTFSPAQIQSALQQQEQFFEYISHQKNKEEFDSTTIALSRDIALRDWLFPLSSQIDLQQKNQWYSALEIAYNPLPVWQATKKPILMLFGEFDDSTPTARVQDNIAQLRNPNIKTITLKGAQHLGLESNSLCSDIAQLRRFHPQFFSEIIQWIRRL